jgi:hypothetical protein
MHGTDLGYDNKIVAAKTWAALFALRDWAIKMEEGAIEQPLPNKLLELSDPIHQIHKNKEDQQLLQKWKPRNIKLGHLASRGQVRGGLLAAFMLMLHLSKCL